MKQKIRKIVITVVILICKWAFTAVLVMHLFGTVFWMDQLRGELGDITAPMTFFPEKEIKAVTLLVKVTEIHEIINIFYLLAMLLSTPTSVILYTIKLNINIKRWAKISYFTICISALATTIFIIIVNLAYYSKIIIDVPSANSSYSLMCNIVGVCFCILIWRKFFDDVVLICKAVMCRVGKIVAGRKK